MKIFEGKIISTGMTNTVVVEIGRVTPHPLYKKLIRTTKKYKADTNGFTDLSVGSVVEITETRPISKGKFFKVTEVVGSALRDAQDASADTTKQTTKAPKAEKKETEKVESRAEVSIKKEKKNEAKAKKTAVKAKAKTVKKESPSKKDKNK